MYEAIYEAIHHEMDALDEKYAKGAAITKAELESIDLMAHTLKSLAGYEAMRSGESRRGRITERYVTYPRY